MAREYWNLAAGPQIAIGGSLRDHHTYNNTGICKYEILADFTLAVAMVDHQTTKFNSPPNFLAIQYPICCAPDLQFAEYYTLHGNVLCMISNITQTSKAYMTSYIYRVA